MAAPGRERDRARTDRTEPDKRGAEKQRERRRLPETSTAAGSRAAAPPTVRAPSIRLSLGMHALHLKLMNVVRPRGLLGTDVCGIVQKNSGVQLQTLTGSIFASHILLLLLRFCFNLFQGINILLRVQPTPMFRGTLRSISATFHPEDI